MSLMMRCFSPTGVCFVLTSLPLCARAGDWPRLQGWSLSRTAQLSSAQVRQNHGTALSLCRFGSPKAQQALSARSSSEESPPSPLHVPLCSSTLIPWAPQPYQGNRLMISRYKVVSLTSTGHSNYAAHGLCQPTGNWSSTTRWVMAGAILHLFPSGTCCGSFTGSPSIPGWGSQHITPR